MHIFIPSNVFYKNDLFSFYNFHDLCYLVLKVKDNMTKNFTMIKKHCGKILFCISSVVKKISDSVQDSRSFGIMIDESTSIYL